MGHADCPKDAARLKEALEKEAPGLLCLVCNIGPVIGSHVGTDMLAVVFWLTITGANYPSQMLADAFFRLQDQLTRGFMAMGAPQTGQRGTSSLGTRWPFWRWTICRTVSSLS